MQQAEYSAKVHFKSCDNYLLTLDSQTDLSLREKYGTQPNHFLGHFYSYVEGRFFRNSYG